mmetsp:Transcript_22617/g.31657  ORF Transcript_22617/g.31657 Transcript_22617/m.31657 type:complete len:101 (-) Transcript_22617:150-452(-)
MAIIEGDPIPLIIVGNKKDLAENNRKVAAEDGNKLAIAWGARYIETSAKTGENVKEVFHSVIRKARCDRKIRKQQSEEDDDENMLQLSGSSGLGWLCTVL